MRPLREWYTYMKLTFSSLAQVALGLWTGLLVVLFLLEELQFVDMTGEQHVRLFFEMIFPLVVIFVWAQLFSKEWDNRIFHWLPVLPYNPAKMFFHRFGASLLVVFGVFWGSLWLVHQFLLPVSWSDWVGSAWVTAMFLGSVGLCGSVLGQRAVVGLGAALVYWFFEMYTAGDYTRTYTVFPLFHPRPDEVLWNRLVYLLLSFVLMVLACLSFLRRDNKTRH